MQYLAAAIHVPGVKYLIGVTDIYLRPIGEVININMNSAAYISVGSAEKVYDINIFQIGIQVGHEEPSSVWIIRLFILIL